MASVQRNTNESAYYTLALYILHNDGDDDGRYCRRWRDNYITADGLAIVRRDSKFEAHTSRK